MTIIERIEQASASLVVAVFGAVGSGAVWMIRRILTNQKQIEMLQREIEARDKRRQEDREDFKELKTDVKEMRSDIRQLFQRD